MLPQTDNPNAAGIEETDAERKQISDIILAEVAATLRHSAPGCIPAAIFFAVLHWRWANQTGTLAWVVVFLLSLVPWFIWDHRCQIGKSKLTVRRLSIVNGLVCVAWALAPCLMMPANRESQYFLIGIALAALIGNIADSAPLRSVFLSAQIPVTIVLALGFVAFAEGRAKLLALVVIVSAFYLDNVAKSRHATARERARLRLQNERMVRELAEANRILRHQSTHDFLTQLPNRSAFTQFVNSALEELTAPNRLALFLMDIDGFKGVNDLYGHQAGDDLLIEASRRLERSMPKTGAIAARFGGDELAACFVFSDAKQVDQVAGVINRTMRQPFELSVGSIKVTASVGIVISSDSSVTESELLRCADIALYRSKRAGKDCCTTIDLDRSDVDTLEVLNPAPSFADVKAPVGPPAEATPVISPDGVRLNESSKSRTVR